MPSTTEPVFVTSPGDEGILLISSDAFSAGGGFDELAMPRLRAHHLVSLPSVAHIRIKHTHATMARGRAATVWGRTLDAVAACALKYSYATAIMSVPVALSEFAAILEAIRDVV